jgi:hypothetical protein
MVSAFKLERRAALAGAVFVLSLAGPACQTSGGGGGVGGAAPGTGGAIGSGGGAATGGAPASGGSGTGGGAGAGGSGAAGSGTRGGASGSGGAGTGGAGTGGTATGGSGAATGGRGGTAGTATGGAGGGSGAGGAAGPVTVESVDVTDVWSGHPVAFALVTRGDQQFAAFFDADRRMTVAQRTLGTTAWRLTRLDTTLGWDSHNYVAMAVDAQGFVHVSGNMHNVPLIYFRGTRALDASSLQRVTSMVGTNEQSATYPEFFQGPAGELVFAYRDGGSGNGDHIFNTYDATARAWRRLLGTPLTNGQGQRNAYPVGPVLGPDGYYHLVWVWRDSPDAETNHDLSYARSRNLVDWQTAGGQALTLPITLATSDIVDPVPVNGGMINNNTKVGFDSQNRAVIVYHKYDGAGNTQLFNARWENGRWMRYQTSAWTTRWAFSGQGTLVFEIEVEGVKIQPDGSLTQEWYHARNGGWGAFRLDPATLRSTATIPRPLPYPRELDVPVSTTPEMVVRWATGTGTGPDPSRRYMLRWETLPSNRDMPRSPIPPATRLRLYAFTTTAAPTAP